MRILAFLQLILAIVFLWVGISKVMDIAYPHYEEIPTTAVVTAMDCELSHNTDDSEYHHISGKYNIYLVCEGNEYCITDEMWFNKLNEGDSVEVILHERHNSEEGSFDRYLTFAE